MAKKTNCTKNGVDYYRIRRKVGKKIDKNGYWVDDFKEFYGTSKKDAESQYAAHMEKKKAGLSGEVQYFGMLADQFIYNVFLKDKNIAPATKELYTDAWNNLIKTSPLAGLPLDQINSLTVQDLYNSLVCSRGTLKAAHNLLRRFYAYLEKEGHCRDITHNLVIPESDELSTYMLDESEVVIWTNEEIKKIMDESAEHRLRLFIILALNTGARISEILALQYSDIEGTVIRINKQVISRPTISPGGKKEHHLEISYTKTAASVRSIPITKNVLSEIKKHQMWHKEEMLKRGYRTDYMFTTNSGGFCDRRNVARSLTRLYKSIDVELKGPHTYRHTFGTNLCKAGVPIQTAATLLGHSNINVTAKYYINIDIDQKQDAIKKLECIINV